MLSGALIFEVLFRLWHYFVWAAHVRAFYFLGWRVYLCVFGAALFLSGSDFLLRRLNLPLFAAIFFLSHGPKVTQSLKNVPLSCCIVFIQIHFSDKLRITHNSCLWKKSRPNVLFIRKN